MAVPDHHLAASRAILLDCQDETARTAEALASGRWTHDYPISVEEASEIDLKVSSDMPEEVYQLINLFPQTSRRRPSVTYVPMPGAPRPPTHAGGRPDR